MLGAHWLVQDVRNVSVAMRDTGTKSNIILILVFTNHSSCRVLGVSNVSQPAPPTADRVLDGDPQVFAGDEMRCGCGSQDAPQQMQQMQQGLDVNDPGSHFKSGTTVSTAATSR